MLKESPDTSLGNSGLERPNSMGLVSRTALAVLLAMCCAEDVSAKGPDPTEKAKIEDVAPLVDKADEGDEGITMKTLKAKGAIIKRVEKDLEILKGVCADFKANDKFSEAEQTFIDKLIANYKLNGTGSMRDKLLRILSYQKTQFAEYCDILFRLLAHVQILDTIECHGCYAKALKAYFEAAQLYTRKQADIDGLLSGM